MGRAIAALVSTVVGLVLLLSFKTHVGTAGTGVLSSQHQTATPKADVTTSPKPKATAKSTTTKKKTVTTRHVTGSTVDTQYGPVQVEVTLTGSHIDDVTAVQLPHQSRHDIEIDNAAVP